MSVFSLVGGLASRFLGCLKAVARVACDAVGKLIGLAAGTACNAIGKVATVVAAAYDVAAETSSQVGVNFPTVALCAGTACCVSATVLLFTTGLPAVVVPVACLFACAWLARDVWYFLTDHSTGEARAEAILRLSAVLCVGAVLMAATATSPVLGGLAVSLIAAGVLYKIVCSDAGGFEIEQRWGQTAASPVA
jgi:hypothetical protein